MLLNILKQLSQSSHPRILQRPFPIRIHKTEEKAEIRISSYDSQTSHQRSSSKSYQIQELHKHSIVHRDLKADNIM